MRKYLQRRSVARLPLLTQSGHCAYRGISVQLRVLLADKSQIAGFGGEEESEFWDTCSGASSSRFWEAWWLPGHLLRVRRNRCPGLAGLSTADQHWVPSISR